MARKKAGAAQKLTKQQREHVDAIWSRALQAGDTASIYDEDAWQDFVQWSNDNKFRAYVCELIAYETNYESIRAQFTREANRLKAEGHWYALRAREIKTGASMTA
ncbi:hypothetical protein [Nesterenkonia alba]|uniref:hypothetical protein n=1 Tax=Nesterenkonia alba TaxID=515814 RepID=UPI0003B41D1C|nr:hypothetical protein [Nesterenkonia alba]